MDGHRRGSGERDKIRVVGAPQVLDPVGQQDDPLRLQRVDRALVVRDEDDGALVGAQRAEDLLAAGGSRLFVGSSRSSTLAADTTRVARASRVFSPPESTPAGLSTSSPEKRKEPRVLRTSTRSRSGADERMFSRTVRSGSRVSCSWA